MINAKTINNILGNMTNCFKIKIYWFLTLGMVLLSNYYCNGQELTIKVDGTVVDGTATNLKNSPFAIVLNPSTGTEVCTSQTITVNIGSLTYYPYLEGLPSGATATSSTNVNNITTVTISNIINSKNSGNSLTVIIKAYFPNNTCDGFKQEIDATLTNLGCSVDPASAKASVISKVDSEIFTSINAIGNPTIYPGGTSCLKSVFKYQVKLDNFTYREITNGKMQFEIDGCPEILGVEFAGKPVDFTYVPGTPKLTIEVDLSVQNIGRSYYYLYVKYPCIKKGEYNCMVGDNKVGVNLKGESCGVGFSIIPTSKAVANVTTGNCGDVPCDEYLIFRSDNYLHLPCPKNCSKSSFNVNFNLSFSPGYRSFTNREVTIDIPAGLIVKSATAYSSNTLCAGAPYLVTYFDKENKEILWSVDTGALIRKVRFTSSCSLNTNTNFNIGFSYNEVSPPESGTKLEFIGSLALDSTTLRVATASNTVAYCTDYTSFLQVKNKKTNYFSEQAYGLPGEYFTYRLRLDRFSVAKNDIKTISDLLSDKLVYAGNFKYAFSGDSNPVMTSLSGQNSFFYPDLGTVSVTVPKIGESGNILLDNINFPCLPKSLYIEFDVRVKSYVTASSQIPNRIKLNGVDSGNVASIFISSLSHVKSKMFVKCSKAKEWNEDGINVKNDEDIDFKMQFSNVGSEPVLLSELVNLKPQSGDLYELGSSPRGSTLKINYSCDSPSIATNSATIPKVIYKYANNPVTMDRDMLCPKQDSGNLPDWTPPCTGDANWLNATFSTPLSLYPGEFVEVVYKGKITGGIGTANNSFAFKLNGCSLLSASSNTLVIKNDGIGLGCDSCTLENPYSSDMKDLFVNLLRSIITRVINGESDSAINGSNPDELIAIKPYITNGGGNKIYHFASTRNAAGKITSIGFSFSDNIENDVLFLEEKGLNYNPEVGAVDESYLKIDTSLYSDSNAYLTTCRKDVDANGVLISACNSKTQVRHVDFCPAKFCYPMKGDIKIDVPPSTRMKN